MSGLVEFQNLALSYPEAIEEPHFDKTSFRVRKKIFATFDTKLNRVCVKLSTSDQDVFSLIDPEVIYPIPNKWGQQGWTFIEFDKVDPLVLQDAIRLSYCEVAPKKIASEILSERKNNLGSI